MKEMLYLSVILFTYLLSQIEIKGKYKYSLIRHAAKLQHYVDL